jgi:hypothetical protein
MTGITSTKLADGRELIYFDDHSTDAHTPDDPAAVAASRRIEA